MTMGRKAWLIGLAAVIASLMVLAPAASAETITVSGGETTTIPLIGNASPYPSLLKVQGGDGNIKDVNVKLTLSHSFPDDLDIALVSPDGDAEVLMSDVCGGTDIAGVFTFNSEAGTDLTDGGPCVAGSFQPTNIDTTENWTPPGPGGVTTAQLANFNGEDPNGLWELFIIDEASPDEGSIAEWSLTIETDTAEVIIPGTGTGSGKGAPAKPYPSTKTFNTAPGQVVSDVNFTTPDFNHSFPDDVDMLLAGPRAGATTLLMSDACGTTEIHDFEWTFDDEALAPMTDGSITGCNPFAIKPSAFETPDVFPAPAPSEPYGSTLSVFDGLEGGTWSLFAVDDVATDTGFMTSWTLKVSTRDAADTGFAVGSLRVEEGGTAVLEVKRTGPADLGPATVNVSVEGAAKAGADFIAPSATLQFARGEASQKISIPIANDKVGEAIEKFKVVLSSPQDDARLVGTTSSEVVIGPDNEIKFGKLRRNAKKGTGTLFVTVPGPGTLVVSGEQVKKVKKTIKKAGKVGLLIKPKGNALGLLEEEGAAKLRAKVSFTPDGGTAFKKTKKLKLVLGS